MPIHERAILHADVDAFFAAVEQRDDRALRGRPVVVGGGVVMAASYEARAYGVRGGMGGSKARRLCPDLVVARPRFDAYAAASKEVFAVFRDTAPVVEGMSLEEAFLDVTGLEHISGTPLQIAARLRAQMRERVGLTLSVGGGRSKVVAKMASRESKPDGLLIVPAGGERAFMHPLAVQRLWGVGPATAARMHERGIATVGQLAELGEPALVAILGKASGRHVHALAHSRDRVPVQGSRRRRSFGAQRALGRRRMSPDLVEAALAALVDRVTRRMRTAGYAGRTVLLALRFDDYTRATRSISLPRATAASRPILAAARVLLAAALPTIESQGLTLVGVTVTNLADVRAGVQLELPFEARSPAALEAALDAIRDRFGTAVVTRAAHLRLPDPLEG